MKKKKEIKGNKEAKERIWKIRDSIQGLEDIKDQIITYLNSQERFDTSTKDFWITDAKEINYNIVAAWEMLRAISEGKKRYVSSCKAFLETAKSRLEQSSSELKVFGEKRASQLETELRKAFEKCYNAISTELEKLSPEKKPQKPIARIVKASDKEYQLPCSACGKIAVVFRIGKFLGKEGLIYRGITHETSLNLDDADKIFDLLEKDKISEVHSYVKKYHVMEDGLDAYCPPCDGIYCRKHFNVKEYWDAGFYDYSEGTCPKGHTRIIDD